jgi:hypothetical protein
LEISLAEAGGEPAVLCTAAHIRRGLKRRKATDRRRLLVLKLNAWVIAAALCCGPAVGFSPANV